MGMVNFTYSKFNLKKETPQHIKDFFLNTDLDVPEELDSETSLRGIFSMLRGQCGVYPDWDGLYNVTENEDGTMSISARISRKNFFKNDVWEIFSKLKPYLQAEPFDILCKLTIEDSSELILFVWGPEGTIDTVSLPGYYNSDFGFITDSNYPTNFSGEYNLPWTYVEFYEKYKARKVDNMTMHF